MPDNFYGVQPPKTQLGAIEAHLEELSTIGYSVMDGVVAERELSDWRRRIDDIYAAQAAVFGEDLLKIIGELDVCRAPLLQDPEFIKLIMNERIHEIMRRIIGDWFILNLQNAVINRPDRVHHQSAWHRDLPYQNWVISRPLAVGALYVIDEFSEITGATMFLPGSHRLETLPSLPWISKHAVTVKSKPGSVILFDAMLFHRAGLNSSKLTRRAVNHLYTVPILKQQYDFPRSLGEAFPGDPLTRRVLGFTSQVPINALEWRRERARKFDIKT